MSEEDEPGSFMRKRARADIACFAQACQLGAFPVIGSPSRSILSCAQPISSDRAYLVVIWPLRLAAPKQTRDHMICLWHLNENKATFH